jgi:hypothetical protein
LARRRVTERRQRLTGSGGRPSGITNPTNHAAAERHRDIDVLGLHESLEHQVQPIGADKSREWSERRLWLANQSSKAFVSDDLIFGRAHDEMRVFEPLATTICVRSNRAA